jgi:monomeric sarcosine oxidase
MDADQRFDVAVVGAGVFGSWTAHELNSKGKKVLLLDAYGPGNSRASSGGESRIIRMGYGSDQIYTRLAKRSLSRWCELLKGTQLFRPSGVLWLARANDPYCQATLKSLEQEGVRYERLTGEELVRRYPQFTLGPVAWGIYEPDSGILLARQAVQRVVQTARENGVSYLTELVTPPVEAESGNLKAIKTSSGKQIYAQQFVFACGPWLPQTFPQLLNERIHVTRQEVFFFGVPAGSDSFAPEHLPAWIDFNDLIYGIPNLDNRGLKIAIDEHGPEFNPDTGERIVSAESVSRIRDFLVQRLPLLARAPVIESRVCQYENTCNGDFLIDRHPSWENVWLVGGGSGHGFKHGPAVGEHVANLLAGEQQLEPRFALATKERVQQRSVY